jgi:methyl-accepting chemotaxis protein
MTIIRSVKLTSVFSIISLLVIAIVSITTTLVQIKHLSEITKVLFIIQKKSSDLKLLQNEIFINERNLLVFIGLANKQNVCKKSIDSLIVCINTEVKGIVDLSGQIKELSSVKNIADSANENSHAYAAGIDKVASQLTGDFALDAATANAMLFPYRKYSDSFKKSINAIDSLVSQTVDTKRESIVQDGRFVIFLVVTFGISGLLLTGLISFFVIRQLKKGFSSTITQMHNLSKGSADLSKRIKYTSKNEIRVLTDSINSFMDFFQNIIENVATVSEKIKQSSTLLTDATESLGKSTVKTVDAATGITKASQSGAKSTSLIVGKTDALVENVVSFKSALHSVNNSMNEIVEKCEKESLITNETNQLSSQAADLISQLENVSQEIGAIVTMIDTIAKQTNLLALNAAITAADAGDAGRSFSVVATEVKSLANKTVKATENISKKIIDVQKTSDNTAKLIKTITHKISAISEVSDSIVHGVNKERGSINALTENINSVNDAVDVIASNVNENANELNAIIKSSNDVESVAQQNSRKVRDIQTEISNLNKMAKDLESIVYKFEHKKKT